MKKFSELSNNLITKEIKCDISKIPTFIDSFSEDNKQMWSLMQNIFTEISKLAVNRILSEVFIDKILSDINDILDYIFKISIRSEFNIQYIFKYFEDLSQKYFDLSIEYELYEISSNFQTFRKLNSR